MAIGLACDFERMERVWKNLKIEKISNDREGLTLLKSTIESFEKKSSEISIVVDSVGSYSEPLIYYLTSQNYRVYQLETKAVRTARRRLLDIEDKSDRSDACCLAYLLFLRDTQGLSFRISEKQFKKPSLADELYSLSLQRYTLIRENTRISNRLHSLYAAVFPEAEYKYFRYLVKMAPYYPTPEKILNSSNLARMNDIPKNILREIKGLALQTIGIPGKKYEWLIKELGIMRRLNDARIVAIDKRIHYKLQKHPYYQILASFPGVGEKAACTLIGVIHDISYWPNKAKLRKGLGVYGRTEQSATMKVSFMGREGNRHARRVLFQVVMSCISHTGENPFRYYYNRQVSRGKIRIKAVMATMGKIAEIMYCCLKEDQLFDKEKCRRNLCVNRPQESD